MRLPPRLPVLLSLGAVAAAVFVVLTQVRGRGPLLWDEAIRVEAGLQALFAARDGGLLGVWTWVNAQTYYPFLAPALHGLVYLVTGDAETAAWFPSVVAYACTGAAAGWLAARLGAGRFGVAVAALLCWTIPIEANLAGGGFTEPLGGLGYLLCFHLLLTLHRRPQGRAAIGLGVLVAATSWLKLDYALVELAVLGAIAGIGLLRPRDHPERWYCVLAAVVASVVAGGLFFVNHEAKIAGMQQYLSAAVPAAAEGADIAYYLRALFVDPAFGMPAAVVALLLAGFAWSVAVARRRADLRPLILFALAWYALYTSRPADIRYARYAAPLLPALAILAGAAVGSWWQRVEAHLAHRPFLPRRRRYRMVGAVAAVLGLGLMLLPQTWGLVEGPPFISPNPALAAARAALHETLGAATPGVPMLLLGPSNELSPYALKLLAEERNGATIPWVYFLNQGPSRDGLLAAVRALRPSLVVGVNILPGSRLDTDDYQKYWAATQPAYYALALQLEVDGALRRVGGGTYENGLLVVTVWTPSLN